MSTDPLKVIIRGCERARALLSGHFGQDQIPFCPIPPSRVNL